MIITSWNVNSVRARVENIKEYLQKFSPDVVMMQEIKFTDKAIKQINNLLSQKDPGSFFRIAIKGGGCSGFQYEFTFDKKLEADDLKHENILIDKTSADLLKVQKWTLSRN